MALSNNSRSTSTKVVSPVFNAGVDKQLTAQQVKAHLDLILDVQRKVMKADHDYGIIPGTKKPSLWKPGAEKICAALRLSVGLLYERLPAEDGEVAFIVTATVTHIPSGKVFGQGLGACSTGEEKYMWKACYSAAQFDETPEDQKRIQRGWNRDEKQEYTVNQIRNPPLSQLNTILKMASKRAKVDAVLSCTAASDIFSQDLEDEEPPAPAARTGSAKADSGAAPQPRSGSRNTATDRQLTMIRNRLDVAHISQNDFCIQYEIEHLSDLPFDKVDPALKWIAENTRPADREKKNADQTASSTGA